MLSSLDVKKQNSELTKILISAQRYVGQSTIEGRIKAVTVIQSAYRKYLAQKSIQQLNMEQEEKWQGFVDKVSPQPSSVRTYLQQLTVTERLELTPWKEHLKKSDSVFSANFLMNLTAAPTINNYAKLLVAIVVGSGIIGLCTLAALGFIGVTTAALVSGAAALMGVGFFSVHVKTSIDDCSKPNLHCSG